jgi:dienelactone hydrolase
MRWPCLFRPDGEARHPAVVLLHGCGGRVTRFLEARLED